MSDLSGYVKLPREILALPGLSLGVFKTLLVIMSFAYGSKAYCWPSHEAISRLTGLSRRTTIRHIAILEKQGFIERVIRPGRTDYYTIVPKKFSPDFQKSVRQAMPTLHPMLKRKARNKDWQTLIRNERELRRMGICPTRREAEE